MSFKKAITKTPGVADSYRVGFQALRAQDKPHIQADTTTRLTGEC